MLAVTEQRSGWRLIRWVVAACVMVLTPVGARAEFPWAAGERVLFIGDSITQAGQYVALTEAYLWAARPELDLEIINAGLSSETVSGMTEPVHPGPRPDINQRLSRALELVRPDWVVVCYGMNDGIYHPASPEIVEAYRAGLKKVVDRVVAGGAKLILLTPPSFDADAPPVRKRLAEVKADEPYGYSNPYAKYDETLVALGAVVKSYAGTAGVDRVIDVHAATDAYLKRVKQAKPDYAYGDGVHPPADGHLAMAIGLLAGLDCDPAEAENTLSLLAGLVPADREMTPTPEQSEFRRRLLTRFDIRSAAFRQAIAGKPVAANTPSLDQVEAESDRAGDELRGSAAKAISAVAVSPTRKAAAEKRWGETIAKLEQADKLETHPDDAILFLGSSSIRMWADIATDLAPHHPIQRGYGGARYSDLAVFAERLIQPHRYAAAVVFVGNDVTGNAKDTPMDELQRLVRHVISVSQRHQPNAPVLLVEVTPTPSRWKAWPKIREVNRMLLEISLTEPGVFFVDTAQDYLDANKQPIPGYFLDDMLHQNRLGYTLWASLIRQRLDEALRSSERGRLVPEPLESAPAGQ